MTTEIALGIDGGGTGTRWALVNADGTVLVEGKTHALYGVIRTEKDRKKIHDAFAEIAQQIVAFGTPRYIVMGLTALGQSSSLIQWFTQTIQRYFCVQRDNIFISGDMPFAYMSCLKPGEGYLVYAGTGSIAAYIDLYYQFHRLGGRGALLDDAGAGYWVAKEALRMIWREEDFSPGSWKQSAMACRLFEHLGSSSWDASRAFVYESDRGQLGLLAVHVAASAEEDPMARDILKQAGRELARLGSIALHRFGARKMVLSGGAAHLHPYVFESFKQALPQDTNVRIQTLNAHVDCACLVAKENPELLDIFSRLSHQQRSIAYS